MPAGCGRALIMPRELTVDGSELIISPIPETAALRIPGSYRLARVHSRAVASASATGAASTSTSASASTIAATPAVSSASVAAASASFVSSASAAAVTSSSAAAIASGSQVEVRLLCAPTQALQPSTGKTGIRTLSTADGSQYTEIGYDWASQTFYADHSQCCSATRKAIVQAAPLSAALLSKTLNLTVRACLPASHHCIFLHTDSFPRLCLHGCTHYFLHPLHPTPTLSYARSTSTAGSSKRSWGAWPSRRSFRPIQTPPAQSSARRASSKRAEGSIAPCRAGSSPTAVRTTRRLVTIEH